MVISLRRTFLLIFTDESVVQLYEFINNTYATYLVTHVSFILLNSLLLDVIVNLNEVFFVVLAGNSEFIISMYQQKIKLKST